MANSITNKKLATKTAAKPKEVEVKPVIKEVPEIKETEQEEITTEPVVKEEVKVEAPKPVEKEVKKELEDGDVYIHNILGTENSKWEVRRKTAAGYKVLGKYAYEKAKAYASQFGPVREA